MRSTRKLERLIAIGLPLRSMIQPRRGGTRISCTRLLFGQQLIFLVLGDRQPAHAADQQCADRGLGAADQHHPPRKGQRLVDRRQANRAHRPSLQRSIRETAQLLNGKTRIEIRIGRNDGREGRRRADRRGNPPLAQQPKRQEHCRERPFEPIIAPHRAPVDEVEGDHRRTPKCDREAYRVAGEQVVDEAQRRCPPGREGVGAEQPPADQHQKAEVRDTSR